MRTKRVGTAGEDTLAEPGEEGGEAETDRRSLQRLAYADGACARLQGAGRFDRIEIIDFVTARHGEIDHLSGAPCDGFERRAQAPAKRAVVSGDPRQIENTATEMIARIAGAAVHVAKLVQRLQKIMRGRLAELRVLGNMLQPRGTTLLCDNFENRGRALDGLDQSDFRHHAFIRDRYSPLIWRGTPGQQVRPC